MQIVIQFGISFLSFMSWLMKHSLPRWCHLSKLPLTLSQQHWEIDENTSGKREDIDSGVHLLRSCRWTPVWVSKFRLCQNYWWGRDNLDGQELRHLLRSNIFDWLLPAANPNNEEQQSRNLLPHKWRWCMGWLESQLECGVKKVKIIKEVKKWKEIVARDV